MLTKSKKAIIGVNKKKYTLFRPKVHSRHPSHSNLRTELPLLPFRSCIRLGSTTERPDTVTNGGNRIECNTVEAVKNSSNKLLMKQCFSDNDVITADWWYKDMGTNRDILCNGSDHSEIRISALDYPIIAKSLFGSRGNGNTKLDTQEELEIWMRGKTLSNYIFEKFYSYTREYRLHITKEGCFYTCRKMLKRDAPEENKWQRHDDNCVWILEDNEAFDKPVNWDTIIEHSVKALNAVGLDIGAVDVKVQSATKSNGRTRTNPKFIIIEINSAPSFGIITEQKYLEQIPKILKSKYGK